MMNKLLGGADDVTSSIIARTPKKSRPSVQPRRRITPVPLDSSGRPIFPIELGSLTVYSLGEVGEFHKMSGMKTCPCLRWHFVREIAEYVT